MQPASLPLPFCLDDPSDGTLGVLSPQITKPWIGAVKELWPFMHLALLCVQELLHPNIKIAVGSHGKSHYS
jgi:hypothetical protein